MSGRKMALEANSGFRKASQFNAICGERRESGIGRRKIGDEISGTERVEWYAKALKSKN